MIDATWPSEPAAEREAVLSLPVWSCTCLSGGSAFVYGMYHMHAHTLNLPHHAVQFSLLQMLAAGRARGGPFHAALLLVNNYVLCPGLGIPSVTGFC